MQKIIAVVTLSIVVSCGLAVHGEDDPSKDKGKPESFWMKKKLDYSQQILAGLTKEDFDLLMQNARSNARPQQNRRTLSANRPVRISASTCRLRFGDRRLDSCRRRQKAPRRHEGLHGVSGKLRELPCVSPKIRAVVTAAFLVVRPERQLMEISCRIQAYL